MVKFKIYMFKALWKIALINNSNRLKFPLYLIEETCTSLHYRFHHINPQIGLEIIMDEYCEIMITFDNRNKERMDHIVLVWEPYEVISLSEHTIQQWFDTIVEYTQTFFTDEYCLSIVTKPQHYSYASIISRNNILEYTQTYSVMLNPL